MATVSTKQAQQGLHQETPAVISDAQPGQPAAQLELIDDKPDVVKMDLRKFNRTRQKISAAVNAVQAITAIESLEQVNNMTNLLKTLTTVEKDADAKRKELGDPYRLEVNRINDHAKDLVKGVAPAVKHGKDLILAFHKTEEAKAKALRTASRVEALIAAGLTPVPRKAGETEVIDWHFADCSRITGGQVEDLPDDIYLKVITDMIDASKAKATADLEKEKESADFFGDAETSASIDEKISEVTTSAIPVAHFASTARYAPPPAKGLTKRWVFEVTAASLVPREYLQVDEKKIREAVGSGIRSIPGVRIYQDESITLR